MTITQRFVIECDQCGWQSTTAAVNRRRHAARIFADEGWDVGKGNIADLCPDCVEFDFSAAGVTPKERAS